MPKGIGFTPCFGVLRIHMWRKRMHNENYSPFGFEHCGETPYATPPAQLTDNGNLQLHP